MKLLAKISFLIIFFSISSVIAQVNLVPNPSFENYSACPDDWDQLSKASGWIGISSPDYFNSCGSVDSFSTPKNFIGTQNASNGNAYAGFIGYSTFTDGSEVLQTTLSSPLIVGNKYYVSLKVVFKYLNPFNICCAQNKIGIKFTNTTFSSSTPPPTNNISHVYTNQIISDTANWTLIKGSFIADSAYTKIMIGNFFSNSNISINNINPAPGNIYSYYFVDEPCVSTDSSTCYTFTDVKELNHTVNCLVYPTITSESVSIITTEMNELTIIIYDLVGKRVLEDCNTRNRNISLSGLNQGLYNMEIQFPNKQKILKKIIKQ